MSIGLTGCNLVGQSFSSEGKNFFEAVNPYTNQAIEPSFFNATSGEVESALIKASDAFTVLQQKSEKEIAHFLRSISEQLQLNKGQIISRYLLESGLNQNRAEAEFNRALLQIDQFAELADKNGWKSPSIDTGVINGARKHPDIRKMYVGIGPVVVFGASNFPLAYSTAGTDCISALTAGCPVIVKAHPYHPGTSELVAQCLRNAVEKMNFPDGTFSHLFDDGYAIAEQLVRDHRVKAVGFTGSESGGKALVDLTNSRPDPIPVFAEMGSSNPIVVLPNRLTENRERWSELISTAVTNDAGQFCTKPGLLFVLNLPSTTEFIHDLQHRILLNDEMIMIHPNLLKNYTNNANERLKKLGRESTFELKEAAKPIFTVCSSAQFLKDKSLQKEVFGPFLLVIQSETIEELNSCLAGIEGQLTGSIFGSTEEIQKYADTLTILRNKVGRVIINGVPTGVSVCPSMHHGGPFPASSDSRFSSVGIDAILRFTRPQAFQNWPNELLPDELKDENPCKLNRRIDGKWTFAEIKP